MNRWFPNRPEGGSLPPGAVRGLLIALVPSVLLISSLVFSAALEESAAAQQRVRTGLDGVRITGNGKEIRATGGCAYVKNGDKVIEAGNCDDTGDSGKTGPTNTGSANTGVQNTTTPRQTTSQQSSTSLEDTSSPDTSAPTSMGATLPSGSTLPDLTSSGETTLPQQMTSMGGASCPTSPPKDAVAATVKRAIDGDTVELAKPVKREDTVRFIGVNTPELKGKDGKPEPGAQEAKTFTRESLEGKRVLLEIGKDPKDDYGRLLAYVWTQQTNKPASEGLITKLRDFISGKDSRGATTESQLFEKTLIEWGYAKVMTVEPNSKYEKCLEEIAHGQTTSSASPSGIHYQDTTGSIALSSTGQYGSTNGAIPPRSSTPEQSTTEQTTSEQTTSEQTAPEQTTSEPTSPKRSAPQGEATEQTTRAQDVKQSTALTPSTPEQTTVQTTTHQQPPAQTATHQQPSTATPVKSALTAPSTPPPAPIRAPAAPSSTDSGPTLASTSIQPSTTSASELSPMAPFPLTTLPQQKTANGSVPVLPDTGGLRLGGGSTPTLMLGVGLFILGLSASLLARSLGPEEHANGRRRREL